MSEWNSGFAVPKPTKRLKVPRRNATGNQYKDRSIAQEDRIAAEMTQTTGLPWERVHQSGANKEHPGDVRSSAKVRLQSHKWLLELKSIAKMTTGRQAEKVMSIEWAWLLQIMAEAVQENSLPALLFSYPGDTHEFVVLKKENFQRLLWEHVQMTNQIDG